ncbi:uncharacterized protein VP01_4108g1 [Puccinia sorghi]|uniref:Uncharacterized protein n=1 Tax=Puccinia sorghi TaxID=27349 RepID=A0A0L6UT75_9BASI|nr:uncharacterized protein VP01_4108g1 [Puccinia sorghi]
MASPASRPSPAPSTPASQAPTSSSAAAINPATKKKEITAVQAAKAKAMNTSDGSFLERFKKMKEEEVEKKKQEDALARKQAFEQRITSKKGKTEEEDNAYLREVRKLQGHSLRDEGAGVRALVKYEASKENQGWDSPISLLTHLAHCQFNSLGFLGGTIHCIYIHVWLLGTAIFFAVTVLHSVVTTADTMAEESNLTLHSKVMEHHHLVTGGGCGSLNDGEADA